MTKLLRTTLAASVAALTFAATPATAAPVGPDNGKNATATARIVKPLTLAWVQDLDLGTATLIDAAGGTVGITRGGTFSCPTTTVTCSGTPKVAKYKITGVNNASVKVNVNPTLTLTHQTDSTQTLVLTVDAPASVPLGNSGQAGTEFSIGGSVNVNGSKADGLYSGTFDVTVEY
jgi:hypothetical protein